MADKDTSDEAKMAMAVLVLLLLIPMALFEGFVLSKLWLWFVSRPFGVFALSVPVAAGLITIRCLVLPRSTCKEPKASDFAMQIIAPAIYLLIGCAIKAFM